MQNYVPLLIAENMLNWFLAATTNKSLKEHFMKLAEVQTFVSDLSRASMFYESVIGLESVDKVNKHDC